MTHHGNLQGYRVCHIAATMSIRAGWLASMIGSGALLSIYLWQKGRAHQK